MKYTKSSSITVKQHRFFTLSQYGSDENNEGMKYKNTSIEVCASIFEWVPCIRVYVKIIFMEISKLLALFGSSKFLVSFII